MICSLLIQLIVNPPKALLYKDLLSLKLNTMHTFK